jgi:hypothetical protein
MPPFNDRAVLGKGAMQLLGIADLVAHWVYTRQRVHKLLRRDDFPSPWGIVNQGRTKLWRLEDIEMFEKLHPEVRNESHKKQRMVGYHLAVIFKNRHKDREFFANCRC